MRHLGELAVTLRWRGFSFPLNNHQLRWCARFWHVGDDHIHLFVSIPPKYSVAYAMAIIKGKSSAWIKKKTKKLPHTLWERGYFVSTVGVNEEAIKRYVESQHLHHSEFKQQSLFEKIIQRA